MIHLWNPQRLRPPRSFARHLILLTLFTALPIASRAEPVIPANDSVVIATLPNPAGFENIRRLRQQLSQNPRDITLVSNVVQQYMTLGKQESDPRYYGYAEAILVPYLKHDSVDPDLDILWARLLQHRHDFDAALSVLQRILSVDPANANARLTRAVIFMVRGQYDRAATDCRATMGRTDPMVTTICVTQMRALTGQLQPGYVLLHRLVIKETAADPEIRLWALTTLGEMAWRLGDSAAAENWFQRGLEINPRDYYLLAVYADLLLAHHSDQEVVDLVQEFQNIDSMLLRLALAKKALGRNTHDEFAELKRRYHAMELRGETTHLRDVARFYLELDDNATQAMQLARLNWQQQKEPADLEILIKAARASGDRDALAGARRWQKETGLESATVSALLAPAG